MAGISAPRNMVDYAEVDDRYAHVFFEHLEAIGLAEPGKAYDLLDAGELSEQGRIPTNLSGGHLGIGMMHEATCLYQLREAVMQLRGEAGQRQLPEVDVAVVQSWRGIPTRTGAFFVLSAE